MNQYRISLPRPPSNNRYYRHNRGRTHISAEGQAYRDSVARIIKDSMLDIGTATPLKIRIECHMPDRRRRDWTICKGSIRRPDEIGFLAR